MATLYERLQATALRLIVKYGRDVTLQFATDAAPPDAARPWEPASPTLTAPHVARAVVFPVEQQFVDGTVVLGTDQQAILAAKGLPGVPDPKTVFLDGTTPYRVIKVDPIKTGPIPLVYTLFLRR